jgi:uncharacterized membrane protein YdfJ with MMPL/SSD domain
VPAGSAGVRRAVARLAARAGADPAVGHVQTAFGRDGLPILRSRDDRQTLLLVHLRSTDENTLTGPVDRIRRLREPGLKLSFGGYATGEVELNRIARRDLVRAELIAFPLLALLMALIFRGFAGAAIPLVIGGVSVLGTLAVLRALSHVLDISIFALNLAVLLGLGLAVDYALLLVSRYREEIALRGHGAEAARVTLATAGRTVVFSGCAVAAACAPLMIFPQSFIYSMGIAGVFVALLAAAVGICVTIPLLLLAGDRIAGRAAPAGGATRWHRMATWVMRHPVDLALVGVLVLVAAAAPALRADLSFPDLRAVPPGVQARTVADVVARDFTPNLEVPVSIVTDGAGRDAPSAAGLTLALAKVGGVAAAGPVSSTSGSAVAVQAVLTGAPLSATARRFVERARALPGSPPVGGRTAQFIDLEHSIRSKALIAALLVATLTFLILFALTRSVVLPLKALAFQALALLAVVGLLVLIFQHNALGLSALIGYDGPRTLDITILVVIVASTFGLAVDYSILLLSRIVEEHRCGRSDEEAIASAIERTGPVITSAATVLCAALLALATSQLFLIKQLTIGQVLGVVIDVTLVRLVLVPSFMRVLGPRNWWAPRVFRRRA